MAEELVIAAEQAAKNAKKAMVMTVIAVAVAIAVLAIDNTIKNNILREAKKAQALFDQITEAANGASQAGGTGTDPGNSIDSGSDLVHDAASGEILDQAANGTEPAPGKRPARTPRGSSGNG